MSVNQVDKQTGDTSRIAGGTLYADAPIGAILAFGGSSAPAGWMICNGAAISRTTYAALFAAIGTAFGAGDGSTTFNLPDPREAALVGAGTNVLNAGSIAAHNAVSLGAFQDDQFQTHAHHVYINNDPNYPVLSNKNLKADGEDYWNVNPSGTYPIVASTEYEGNRAGATTHGKQLGVNYIIKAQQVALPADFATELDKKQNITDNTLQTDSKTVPGAINEVNTKASHSDYVEYISSTTDTYGYLICGLLKLADLSKLTPHSKIVVGGNANYYSYRGFDREFYQFSSAVTDKSGNMINIYIAGHISPHDWGVFREFHVDNAGVVTVNDISANQIGAEISIRLYY